MPAKNIVPLLPNQFYHVYNRGVAQQNIFYQQENFAYFLSLYFKHTQDIVDTYAYCLLNNHFHLLVRVKIVRVKNEEQLATCFSNGKKSLSQPFSNCFNAYTQSINKQQERTGGLFERPYRRVLIESETQLLKCLYYIHANPEKHKLISDYREYPHSSWHELTSLMPTKLSRNEVWEWFDGKKRFIEHHISCRQDQQGT